MRIVHLKTWLPIFLGVLIAGGCARGLPPSVMDPSRAAEREAPPEPDPKQEEDAGNAAPDPELNAVLHQFQKGIQLLEGGRAKEARPLFEALRGRYPDVSVIHNNLGVTYKRLNLLKEAAKSYQKAIDLQGGGYTEAHYNLAIVFREQGAFRKAEAVYRRVIALNPEFQDAHYNLAVLYDLYLDEAAEALRHYKKYMELVEGNHEEIKLWVAALQKRINDVGGSK